MGRGLRRLDQILVERGLFANAQDALRSVLAGDVSTSGRRLDHAGELLPPDVSLHVRGHLPYVGRGGLKLERGLDAFGVDPSGLACLDVGCSTGGFTDCLLKRGAASVLSVDVGYAQFDWTLRQDPRVTLLERTNIVDVPTSGRAGSIDLAVCDVSFTSVTTVLPAVCKLLSPDGSFLTLVKPQFEAERSRVGEGGVVGDPDVWLWSLRRVISAFEKRSIGLRGCCASPISGHKGNREFLLLGVCGAASLDLDLVGVVTEVAASSGEARAPRGTGAPDGRDGVDPTGR